jgi:beta-glucosidase
VLANGDVEEGVGQLFSGATWFPPPMALQDVAMQYAEEMGRITAEEAVAIGINWVLAPIVDVNNNPENPVINIRAFGITIGEVMGTTRGFIAGAKQYPVLTTAKHFPGHGSCGSDSHLHLPVNTKTLDELATSDLKPFAELIKENQLAAIMPAHVLYPTIDPDYAAGYSKTWLQAVLRGQLQFQGLIISDCLGMKGADIGDLTTRAEQALSAGCDILIVANQTQTNLWQLLNNLPKTVDPARSNRLKRFKTGIHVRSEALVLSADLESTFDPHNPTQTV